MENLHNSVMINEIISFLPLKKSINVIDATFGGGGYSTGTSHGSPYSYDRYVPVLFAGGGVPKGRVTRAVGPEDIAPTLAALLNIMAPSGSTGQVLQEVLD